MLYFINTGRGDTGRLNYILNTLQNGKPLFLSDKKYLDFLISSNIEKKRISTEPGDPIVELKNQLNEVNQRLEKIENKGYKKHVGRKAIFFFVTFFFSWHAVIQILNSLSGNVLILKDIQGLGPYVFPLYQIKSIIPTLYSGYVDLGILLVWAGMMITWIILGFVYLVKFIRSRYSP